MKTYTVPAVRTDHVHLTITVRAKNARQAERIVEMMNEEALDKASEFVDVDQGDIIVGDAVEKRRKR